MFRKLTVVLLLIAAAAITSFADTITASTSVSGSDSTTSSWNETTYGVSSTIASSGMTGGQTSSSSPFSASISYSPLPSNVSITSATLQFNVVGTELQAQSSPSIGAVINPGYYYTETYWYSYSCGWSTCWGSYTETYWQSYSYSAGAMSTTGYESGFLTQIQSGTMTQNVSVNSGNVDLLALGFGPMLLHNDQLSLGGTTNQFQTNSFTSPGFNTSTNFTNTSSGTADITATLNIVYQQNQPSSTPEPASLALLASGLGAALLKVRRRI